jgi:hypothetical protein
MDPTMPDTLSNFSSKVFAEQLHTRFRTVLAGPETVELELAEVVDHPTVPHMECFSLFFRGPASVLLHQGMRKLEHPHLGAMDLFITPLALDDKGATYEVVFNRNKPKS